MSWDTYTLGRKLGSGTFGTVYLVTRNTDGKEFALKELDTDETGYRGLTEVDILFRLQHPNLLHGVDLAFGNSLSVEEDADVTSLVLELAVGDMEMISLDSSQRPSDLKTLTRFCFECASGLKMLLDNGIQHLDLKPDNVFFFAPSVIQQLSQLSLQPQANSWTAKLADFGIVCYGTPNECRSDKYVYANTYRPPEQYEIKGKSLVERFPRPEDIQLTKETEIEPNGLDRIITTKTPIWALGALFYFILTGRTLIEGIYEDDYDSYDTAIVAEMREKILLSSDVFRILPPAAEALIRRMMVYNPHDRPDINDVLADTLFQQAGYTQVVPGLIFAPTMPQETKITATLVGQLLEKISQVGFIQYRAADYLAVDLLYRVYDAVVDDNPALVIDAVILVATNMFIPLDINAFISYRKFNYSRDYHSKEDILAMEGDILNQLRGIIYRPNLYTVAWSTWSLQQLYPLIYDPQRYLHTDFTLLASKLALLEPPTELEARQNKDTLNWAMFSKEKGPYLIQALA